MSKILVIEDSNFMSAIYRTRLQKTGYEIDFVRDAQNALEKLKSDTSDLIILDLILPVEDGFALLEEIKNNEKLKHIPVLIVTTLTKEEGFERAMGLGADDYLVKADMSHEDLLKKIKKLLAA